MKYDGYRTLVAIGGGRARAYTRSGLDWSDRFTIGPKSIEVQLRKLETVGASADAASASDAKDRVNDTGLDLVLPWKAPVSTIAKGVLHSPSSRPCLSSEEREALLLAIAKARSWVSDIVEHRVTSFAEIARREGKVERHVRFLAPLAFVSPRVITAIADGIVAN